MSEADELTPRALLAGLLIGAVLALANLYMGLKVGFTDSGNLLAALLGFSLMRALPRRWGGGYGLLENQVTHVTAVAVATAPAALGALTTFPALSLLGLRVDLWRLGAFGLAAAGVGLLRSFALERRLIDDERLPFPTGQATAQLLRAVHGAAERAKGRARALVVTSVGSAGWVLFRDGRPRLLPAEVSLPGGLSVAASPMLLGVGALVGVPLASAITLGGLLAWRALPPWLSKQGWASTESLGDFLRWPGVGLLLGAGLTSLLRAGLSRRAAAGRGARQGLRLLAALSLGGVALAVGKLGLGLALVPGLLALALAFAFLGVCVRSAGQTDISPYGVLGQVTQLLLGAVTLGSPASNLFAAGLVSGASVQAANGLWGLKAGRELGGSSRRQWAAQAVGTVFGAWLVVPVYALLAAAGRLGTDEMPAPSARSFALLAQVATGGAGDLPVPVQVSGLLGLGLGALLAVGSQKVRWLPSPVALGVGFLVPLPFALTLLLGAALAWAMARRWPGETEALGPAAATGAIAGEALMGVALAGLLVAGWL